MPSGASSAGHGSTDGTSASPDRSDAPETRSLRKEVEIDASAEAVWTAVSEAEELVRWFPLEARVEPGEGGSIYLSWGEGVEGEARIEAWEPGRRLRWLEGDEVAVELTIEGRGGRAVVRLVQSGFSASADWDEYYDAVDTGWSFFLRNLKHYLERHADTPCHLLWTRRPARRTREEAWAVLTGPGGLAPEPSLPEDPGGGEEGTPPGTSAPVVALEDDASGVAVRLGGEPRELIPWLVLPGRALAGCLPELGHATLFVEPERGEDETGWRCGFWLYTYGLSSDRRARLQAALDELAAAVTGSE